MSKAPPLVATWNGTPITELPRETLENALSWCLTKLQ